MKNVVRVGSILLTTAFITGFMAIVMKPPIVSEAHAESTTVVKQPPKEAVSKASSAPVEPEPAKDTQPTPTAPVTPPATSQASDNETIIWNYLIAQGFTRNQTAGIMGNLKQEHNFQTSGDGLAQWLGNRRANLLAHDNPYDVTTQIAFLVEELHAGEISAYNAIVSSDSVELTTISFQNLFERCNPYYCMQNQRIQYAYDILARH